jgi:protein required for attachment to host cells
MHQQWIVVADAAAARIFSRNAAEPKLSLVDRLAHAQSRAHTGDLRTGGKGTVQESSGYSQFQPDPQTTTPEKHADIFAKQLAERLKSGLNDDRFDSLIIAADPSFLGRIRDHLDGPLKKTVKQTIDKNWSGHKAAKIEKMLTSQLVD